MKRAIIVLAMASGLCGAVHAKEYGWTPSQGSSHGTASAAVPPQSREQGTRREETAAQRAVLEKERKRAITIIEEALKKARERARREAEEARRKRLAEEKQRPAREKDVTLKQGEVADSRMGVAAEREKARAEQCHAPCGLAIRMTGVMQGQLQGGAREGRPYEAALFFLVSRAVSSRTGH